VSDGAAAAHGAGGSHSIVDDLLPSEAVTPSNRQRLFVLFFVGALVDLVVLGLFNDFTDKVYVDSFTTGVVAAVVLQILLKVTIVAEHRVLAQFKGKTGAAWTAAKFFCAWLILFGSKFVILEALTFVFGDKVHFDGIWHGIIWLIIVVVTMVIVEELVVRLYRKLA
jgi:hypothetical protein